MEKKENVKKLSLWQKIKLWYNLKFRNRIPEELRFGAIDAMSVDQVRNFRHTIFGFSDEALHPLFAERNREKLKAIWCPSLRERIINHDDANEVRAYLSIDSVEISEDWAEKYFVNRSIDEFFKLYLDSHDNWLPDEVVELLIEKEQEVLLLYYINQFKDDECHNINQKLLFNSTMETAKYAFAEKFLDDDGCKETIYYILEYGDDALVEKLLQKYALHHDEEYELLFERGNSSFIDLVIEKKQTTSLSDAFWINILEKGTTQQIIKCLDKFSLDAQDEYQLVCHQNNEAILHYLKTTQKPLQEVFSEEYLFSHASAEVLDFYRQNIRLPYTEERALIHDGSAEEISAHLIKHDLFNLNGLLLIEKGTPVVIKQLIEKYEISSLSEVALIRRNNEELTSLYIKQLVENKKKLSEPAEAEFMKRGSINLVQKYFTAFDYQLSNEAQLALLYRGDAALLIQFCQNGFIEEELMVQFVKTAAYEILDNYFAHKIGLSSLAEVTLIERKQLNLIKAYFSQVGAFCDNAETSLVQLKNSSLLKEYLAIYEDLYQNAERELLLLNSDELFLFYIEKTPLFDENEVELVKIGNRAWLEAYIEKYDLSVLATDELAKTY